MGNWKAQTTVTTKAQARPAAIVAIQGDVVRHGNRAVSGARVLQQGREQPRHGVPQPDRDRAPLVPGWVEGRQPSRSRSNAASSSRASPAS